ncbi:MAG: TIGR04438 family Trp-rich protein [Burkholderiaceae bacterium]|jgi:small Trp-rich protein|nr:TIGR04438 family Trp-rich protein [Burkholderiaceae bacterium]
MWLIWLGVVLIVLKLLEISVFATLSWWWITVPFVLAFLWFELVERRLGMDKKKAFDEIDKIKKLRIQRALDANKARRRR